MPVASSSIRPPAQTSSRPLPLREYVRQKPLEDFGAIEADPASNDAHIVARGDVGLYP